MHTYKIPGSSYVPSHSRSSLSNILEANRMSLSSTFPMRFSSRMTNSLLIISFESRRRFGIRLKKSDCKMPRKVAYSVLTCSKEYYRQKRYEAMAYSTLIHILSHTPIHPFTHSELPFHRFIDMREIQRTLMIPTRESIQVQIKCTKFSKFRTSESSSPNCAVIFISFSFCFKMTG